MTIMALQGPMRLVRPVKKYLAWVHKWSSRTYYDNKNGPTQT